MLRYVAVVLVLAVGGGCSAQKVSISVADMPLPDVVQLLRDMTGVQFVGEAAAKALPGKAPTVTLDLQDAPLKTVVKEMCRQAGWHFARFGQGYHLMPGPAEDYARPRCAVGVYEVSLDSVSVQRTLTLNFAAPEAKTSLDHRTNLQLTCESDDDELMAAVWAFDTNVIAVTDTGVTLEPLQKEAWGHGSPHEPLVRGWVPLQPPPPDAKRLARLEGDLILYATVRRAEFEFTAQDVGTSKEAEGLTVALTAFDPRTGQVQCELSLPKDTEEAVRRTRGMTSSPTVDVALLDAEGKAASSSGGSSSGGAEGEVMRYKQQYSFRVGEGFVPAKIRYRVVAASDPGERLTYLLEDIPLPLEDEVAPPLGELP